MIVVAQDDGGWRVYRMTPITLPFSTREEAAAEAEGIGEFWGVPVCDGHTVIAGLQKRLDDLTRRVAKLESRYIREERVPGTDVGEPCPDEWIPEEDA